MHDQPTSGQQATKTAVYVLGAFTLVMGAVAGYKIYQAYNAEATDRDQYYPLLLWGAFNSVAGLAAAFWAWSWKPAEGAHGVATTPTKLILLGVGGWLGLTTVLFLGLGYVYLWWGELTKSRSVWGEAKTWIPVLLILGGLAVMLISVLVVRSEERQSSVLRRLVYGYNAVLVGLLVFALLGVGNVVASIYATRPFDWTETNIYSISDTSKLILQRLDTPVKVYVLLLPRDPLYEDMRSLLESCRSYTSLLDVEYITDPDDAGKVVTEYELLQNTAAVVVYDPMGEKGKAKHEAIKPEDLEDFSSRIESEGRQRNFKGERAVMSAIRNLQEGKITQTIYFTQDSGEMKLSEFGGGRGRPGAGDRGLGSLRSRLQNAGYTVKELNLGQSDLDSKEPAKVPDDAFAVVMAGPTELGEPTLAAAKIKVLQNYMKRKDGKMIILVEAHRNREGVVQPTGLEGFLAGFGVEVRKDIILHPRLSTAPNPRTASTALAAESDRAFLEAFLTEGPIALRDARTVQPLPDSSTFTVHRLLLTFPLIRGANGHWAEEGLHGDPTGYVENLETNQLEELRRKLKDEPICVAVTVRDKSTDASMPDDQVHARARQGEGQPRMVVLGSTYLVSNEAIERGSRIYYNLFAGSLSWLRGRSGDVIAEIEPKERKSYRMNVKPDDIGRILWMPVLVLLIGIVGAGIAVLGFIRRR